MYAAVYRSFSVFALAAGLAACGAESKTASNVDSGVASADSAVVEETGSYIYGTGVASGFIHPVLTIPEFGASMTATYVIDNTSADFDEIYNGGGGTLTAGRLEGTLTGNTFAGYWYEAVDEGGYGFVQRTCEPQRNNERVFGPFSLTFSADRRSFTGTFTTCDGDLSEGGTEWTGTLTRRGNN